MAFRGGSSARGGNRRVTKPAMIFAVLLVGSILVVPPVAYWFNQRREADRTRVEVGSSPRLARAEAALRDLDACSIGYERPLTASSRRRGPSDALLVTRCGAATVIRYRVPPDWTAYPHKYKAFWLERNSRVEVWSVHDEGETTPDKLAAALEEASPVLRTKPVPF